MSKKYLPILIVTALILAVAILALPGNATASQLLGITITPIPTNTPTSTLIVTEPPPTTEPPPVTEPPPTTEPPPVTEPPPTTEPPPATNTPTIIAQTPAATAKPKVTEVVLLPATGEFPIDPGMGMQWFFALTLIFLIGLILFRTVKGAKVKK